MSTNRTPCNTSIYNDESDYNHMHGFKKFKFLLHFPKSYIMDFKFV